MYYTFKKYINHTPQISFEDIIRGQRPETTQEQLFITKIKEENEVTIKEYVKKSLSDLEEPIRKFIEQNPNYEKNCYYSFRIPKSSGGYRTIEAPATELSNLHLQILCVLRDTVKTLPHNTAHAYVKNRGTLTALKVHQKNCSKWFLKLDIKDFFPSCNFDFIYKQLSQIYPFAVLIKEEKYDTIIKNSIKIALRNNKLPQGTRISPLLTNIIMLPIDYKINEMLGNNHRYTRYADDMLISSRIKFNPEHITTKIKKILKEESNFKIKDSKTRFGSSAGSNWNLGMMLNKDNKITIGHKNKDKFRATLNNFIKDTQNNQKWALQDVQYLQGIISYYKMIEPDYIKQVFQKYNNKYNINLKTMLKNNL